MTQATSGRDVAAPPTDPESLLGLCERIVEKASGRGADQAEAYMESGHQLDLDIEKDRVHSVNTQRGRGGAVRVVKDGRLGFAYFTDPDAADDAIEAALRVALHAPKKAFSLPPGGTVPDLSGRWDERYAHIETAAILEDARTLLGAVKDACPDAVVGGGGLGASASSHAIASTEGVACADRATRYAAVVSILLEAGERSINTWEVESAHAGPLDVAALGTTVAERILSLRDPKPVPSGGRFDVILLPHAADLVTDLVESAVDGDDAMRGKTVWSDRLGEAVAAPHLQVTDDPLRPDAIGGTPFDDEGQPAAALPIIQDGILRNFAFDAWDAHEHQRPSTHSAIRGSFKSHPATGIHHLVVASRKAMPETQLMAGVDDGFLVESVLGAHTANATTGEFSVTAANVWRIRNGVVAGASADIALGGSLSEWLQKLDGAGDTPRRMEGIQVPPLRFRDVQISV